MGLIENIFRLISCMSSISRHGQSIICSCTKTGIKHENMYMQCNGTSVRASIQPFFTVWGIRPKELYKFHERINKHEN